MKTKSNTLLIPIFLLLLSVGLTAPLVVAEDVPSPEILVGYLRDEAYTYLALDLIPDIPIETSDTVTVAVLDQYLTSDEWRALMEMDETNVRSITFLTEVYENFEFIQYEEHDYNDYWISQQNQFRVQYDESLPVNERSRDHGFAVSSVIAAIAKNVNLLFVDTNQGLSSSNTGYDVEKFRIWKMLYDEYSNNTDELNDVDVVVLSQITSNEFIDYDFPISNTEYMGLLRDNGVVFVGAPGNTCNVIPGVDGTSTGCDLTGADWSYKKYPSVQDEWYSIGSFDHKATSPFFERKSELSSWFEEDQEWMHNVNFLMPGSIVPVLSSYENVISCNPDCEATWVYSSGTSFSAPYFGGIVALMQSEYATGARESFGARSFGLNVHPTWYEIDSILQQSNILLDGNTGWDPQYGLGTINVPLALQLAYSMGFDSTDIDQDLILDQWEIDNGLNPNDPSDALYDYDGDGLNNMGEFIHGTNPQNPDTDGDGYTDRHEVSWGMDPLVFTDPDEPPYNLVTPSGVTTALKGISYSYTFNAQDPDSTNIYFDITWGDGTYSNAVPATRNSDVLVSKTYYATGYKYITYVAYSMDNGIRSESVRSASHRVYVKRPPGGGGGPMSFVPILFGMAHTERIEFSTLVEISKYR